MNDITLNPERAGSGSQQLHREQLTRERTSETQTQQAMQMHSAKGIQCPHCGTMNEPEAMFCASCGNPIGMATCPNCGARTFALSVVQGLLAMRRSVLNVAVREAESFALFVVR